MQRQVNWALHLFSAQDAHFIFSLEGIMFGKRVKLSTDELRELYVAQGWTTEQIAEHFGVGASTVRRVLDSIGVDIRPRGPKGSSELSHEELSEDLLRELYLDRKLSIPKIAETCGWGRETIRQKMIEFGIPIRSFSESTRVQHGTWSEYCDFSGNPLEKAYLIGLRTGDLHARREHEGSEGIRISGGSSKREQIELLEELFAHYGHIARSTQWRLSLRGLLKYENLAISLNNTFEFLFKYPTEIPEWILSDHNAFLAFFGGFTDAEGSFHLRTRKDTIDNSRFSIKNTDKFLLEQCHARLQSMGIQCSSITKVYEAGRQTSKRGIFANKALWEFSIQAKASLLYFIRLIAPYIKHKARRADMERVRQNVEWRNTDEFRQEATRKRVEANRKTNEAKKKNRN